MEYKRKTGLKESKMAREIFDVLREVESQNKEINKIAKEGQKSFRRDAIRLETKS